MATAERARRVLHVLRCRQPDLTVLAEDVHKPHNLSAMLRSCDAVGIGAVHAVRPTGGVPTFSATSASAEKWVRLVVHERLADAVDALRDEGLQLLAAHFSDRAVDYRDVDYVRPTAVVFGNERDGVSEQAAARADRHVVVPMLGMVRSLNVSVATAVILFEAQRQRREAGLYEAPRLPEAELRTQAYRWLYPRDAARREAAGTALPWIDDDGGIVPPAVDGAP